MQREITESAYKHQKDVERKARIVVGVNEFTGGDAVPIETLRVDPAVERKVVDRFSRVKTQRSDKKVREALERLRNAADDDTTNLMPPILDAVREYASIGEICNVLRDVYGEYQPLTIF
jgi:methylmalonyl-CoA mutase N-terminal domain/subunit